MKHPRPMGTNAYIQIGGGMAWGPISNTRYYLDGVIRRLSRSSRTQPHSSEVAAAETQLLHSISVG